MSDVTQTFNVIECVHEFLLVYWN